MPKLLRIGRLVKALEKVEGAANIGGIFMLCVVMMVLVHWLSCLWYVITSLDESTSWIILEAQMKGQYWRQQYIRVYYTTLMMVSNAGYRLAAME